MPLANRVAPDGAIEAVAARGTLMGNRGGPLHDAHQRLGRRRWVKPAWIACRLDFKGRRQAIMAPGRYTQLFFLDEVTALAAGHRPCAECRREAFERFRAGFEGATTATEIDRALHRARLQGRSGVQRTFEARLGDLPAGVMVQVPDRPGRAWLAYRGALWPWSFAGYGAPFETRGATEVRVLTPAPTVAALAAGFVPELHPSVAC